MDERTRTSDDELAPDLRRTTPEPGVISRPYSKLRIGLYLAIAIGLVIAAYVIVHTFHAPQPANPRSAAGGLQSVGAATVALTEEGGETVLRYGVQAQVGGKLAQIGSRLIDATSRKMADDFFNRFMGIMSPAATGAEPS